MRLLSEAGVEWEAKAGAETDKKWRHDERLMRWQTGGSGAVRVLGHRRRRTRGGGARRRQVKSRQRHGVEEKRGDG